MVISRVSKKEKERLARLQQIVEREAIQYVGGEVLQVENGKFVSRVEPVLSGGYRRLGSEVFIHYKGNTITVVEEDEDGTTVIGKLHDTFPTMWVLVPKRYIVGPMPEPEDLR